MNHHIQLLLILCKMLLSMDNKLFKINTGKSSNKETSETVYSEIDFSINIVAQETYSKNISIKIEDFWLRNNYSLDSAWSLAAIVTFVTGEDDPASFIYNLSSVYNLALLYDLLIAAIIKSNWSLSLSLV